MRVLKIAGMLILFCTLTIFTQVGGMLYLFSIITYPSINRLSKRTARFSMKLVSFIVFYLVGSMLFVPLIAKQFGRVPLPIVETGNVKPGTIWTALMNRNYVRPGLRDVLFNVGSNMGKQYPGTVVIYLDACHPFIDGYPMFGHLSHTDGRKIDVAFCYTDRETGKPSRITPSFTGYGVYEGPGKNEVDQQSLCRQKGFWQADVVNNILRGKENDQKILMFDEPRTKSLINYFAKEKSVQKIFIEPHLKTRLGLTNPKVRFQGCHAARHDDHVHVQIN